MLESTDERVLSLIEDTSMGMIEWFKGTRLIYTHGHKYSYLWDQETEVLTEFITIKKPKKVGQRTIDIPHYKVHWQGKNPKLGEALFYYFS